VNNSLMFKGSAGRGARRRAAAASARCFFRHHSSRLARSAPRAWG
jgi:hypothetical protein